uniref:Peptidase S1 domain-containing protein n=1 Tax=Tetradesmus obliquus TaxID=3088 RepID=A0A383W1B5_TETOB|eukprot:jgi/Sobl393_1/12056/SZX70824.1
MTVAHCVVEPWRRIWWKGLDFYPGRNVPESDSPSGWSPLGVAHKQDVAVHPNWTASASNMQGKPAADAAIIITKQPIGRQLGWLDHRLPSAATVAAAVNTRDTHFDRTQKQHDKQMLLQRAEAVRRGTEAPSAALVEQLVAAAGLPLHVVGYPDNKSNGSMWQQCCSKLDWQLQGNLLWHDCSVRGGNSGSPVWVAWPQEPSSPSTAAAARPVAASSSIGRRLLQHDGTSSTDAQKRLAAPAAGYIQVVGVHSSSLKYPFNSQLGAYAEAMYEQRAKQAAAAGTSGGPGLDGSSATAGDAECVGGAGGREPDGVNVLLPVAVPFTAHTYAWIEDVLQKHTC